MTTEKETRPGPYEPHIGETRQYWRDIILGVNDGLVSTFLLVVGVVGGGPARREETTGEHVKGASGVALYL